MKVGTVAFGPGSGRLVRRPNAVLFDPEGTNSALIDTFDAAASPHEATAMVKRLLVDSGFGFGPFAIVVWHEGLDLVVWGDLAVHTSAASAPMVSGGSSQTWVSHHVEPGDLSREGSVSVWAGAEAAPDTNLRLGIASAGGFRLDLIAGEAIEPAERALQADGEASPLAVDDHSTTAEFDSAVVSAPSAKAARTLEAEPVSVADRGPARTESVREYVDQAIVERAEASPVPPEDAGSSGEDDYFGTFRSADDEDAMGLEGLEGSAADAVATDGSAGSAGSSAEELRPADEVPSVEPDAVEPDAVEPDLAGGAFEGLAPSHSAAGADIESGDAALVDHTSSAVCERGHSNPADSTSCFTCGAPVHQAARSVAGWLRFDDDRVEPVDGLIVVGRRPEVGEGTRPVVVDHPEVSRSHLQIHLDGWAVQVTDLGSSNGTWITQPGHQPVAVAPGTSLTLTDGMVVHPGTYDISILYTVAEPPTHD